MNYNTNQSIFIQIAERICDRVLSGNYKADSRIPVSYTHLRAHET